MNDGRDDGSRGRGPSGSRPDPAIAVGVAIGVFALALVAVIGAVVAFRAATAPSESDEGAEPTATLTPERTTTAAGTGPAGGSPTPPQRATTAPMRFGAAEQVIDPARRRYAATIKTDRGDVVLALYADQAPKTVNSFVFLARKGFFDGIRFHRIVPDFVAQAGDPTGTGAGGPGYETEQEKTELTNRKGTVAMARAAGSTKFGSQFFINLKDNPALDADAPNQARFYPFAEVTSGMDVVLKLTQGDVIRSIAITEAPR